MFFRRSRAILTRPLVVISILASLSAGGCFGRVRDECLDVENDGVHARNACAPDDSNPTTEDQAAIVPARESAPVEEHPPDIPGADACVIFAVAPLQVNVGGQVAVTVFPSPRFPAFLWTASSGQFDEPTAAAARFTCDAPGLHTLTLTVAGCVQKYTATVRCL